MTGAEVRITLKYYNTNFKPDFPELVGHQGPVCVIEIQVVPKWASRPNVVDCAVPRTMSSTDSDCTGRYYYGIVVSFRTEGRFGYFDILRLLVTIGATLSYLRLPMWIVYFIALYCLGPLSSFYYNSLGESLKVDEALVHYVCTTIVSASSFRQLVGDRGTLSKDQLLFEIHNAFHNLPEFDLDEQAMLAELVWDRLSTRAGKPDAIADKVDRASRVNTEENGEIRAHDFVQSMVSKRVQEGLADIFETERCKSPLEWALLPRRQFHARPRFQRTQTGSIDMDCLIGTLSKSHTELGALQSQRSSDLVPRQGLSGASLDDPSPRQRGLHLLDVEVVMFGDAASASGDGGGCREDPPGERAPRQRSPRRPGASASGELSPSPNAKGELSPSDCPPSECDVAAERGDPCTSGEPPSGARPVGATPPQLIGASLAL
mmetsp:Transcript_109993/g.316599  ORF Transcript_109993/g.316599 Transcript_109993/m.316599 type:complete len:433 (+) Transcript_109993:3-1301(+)